MLRANDIRSDPPKNKIILITLFSIHRPASHVPIRYNSINEKLHRHGSSKRLRGNLSN